jgi:ankyrin repeat protein
MILWFVFKAIKTDISLDRFEWLVSQINTVYKSLTPLHFACLVNKPQAVQWLLDHGADVDFATEDGFTAIHWAAMKGHFDCLRLLLDRGAKVDPETITEWTPLSRAMQRLPNIEGDTVVDPVVLGQYEKCIELLLLHGAKLDVVSKRLSNVSCYGSNRNDRGKISVKCTGTRTVSITFGR